MYNFKINEAVLLKNQRVLPKHSKKLTVKWDGTYKVVGKPSDVLIKIEKNNTSTIVHANRLKPCRLRPSDASNVSCPQGAAPQPALHQQRAPVPRRTRRAPTPPSPPTSPSESDTSSDEETQPRPAPLRTGLQSTAARKNKGFYKHT